MLREVMRVSKAARRVAWTAVCQVPDLRQLPVKQDSTVGQCSDTVTRGLSSEIPPRASFCIVCGY